MLLLLSWADVTKQWIRCGLENENDKHCNTNVLIIINITVCVTSPWNSSRETMKKYGNQTLAVRHICLREKTNHMGWADQSYYGERNLETWRENFPQPRFQDTRLWERGATLLAARTKVFFLVYSGYVVNKLLFLLFSIAPLLIFPSTQGESLADLHFEITSNKQPMNKHSQYVTLWVTTECRDM